MLLLRLIYAAIGAVFATQSLAEVPRVATDIAPVHSLVAQVMNGLGEPDLILRPGASPHSYALRPSEARALQDADLVVWMGPELTPWLQKPIEILGPGADAVELLNLAESRLQPLRDPGADHGHDHDHDHGNEAAAIDPHAWLDPENGKIWLGVIARRLAAADPENADQYLANAAAGQARIEAASAAIVALLAPVQGQPHVTFHDAYQYFEIRFDLASAGTVKLSDAADSSPADLAELRAAINNGTVACAFSEPQFDTGLLTAAAEGTNLRIAVLDPMGSALTPGPDLYPALLEKLAESIAECAAE
jgi:zinc transport system substrate-binding protein